MRHERRSPAEILLFDGRIFTWDRQAPIVSCLAIREGQVIAGGTYEELSTTAGPRTSHVSLGGRAVLPGLVDAHIHLEQYARSLDRLDCELPTLEACLAAVHERAQQTTPGEWILGHGWNQNAWGRFGRASELDLVSRAHPIYLTAKSLHAAWANSAALAAAGIRRETPDPPGGSIQRDEHGNPTGILLEGAMQLVSSRLPIWSAERLADSLLAVQDRLWSYGVTAVHDFDGPRCFRALQVLHERHALGLRVVKNIPLDNLQDAIDLGVRTGFGDDWLRLGWVKVFADGALGPRTAAMLAPYVGEPENRGMLLVDSEELLEIGARCVRGGLPLSVHAIGDRANNTVLNAFEALRRLETEEGLPQMRHRIEHLQLLHLEDLSRPGRLGLIASMQPYHATSDMDMAERYWGERVQTGYAWRSIGMGGAVLAFGSDAPVELPNPFWGIHAAITRRRHDGRPAEEGWIPGERMEMRAALDAYIEGPRIAAGQSDRFGRLTPGYLADLIVLNEDPFEVPADGLAEMRPVAVMVGGEWRLREF